jgi:hypothetical protein
VTSKADIELELGVTLDAGITSDYIDNLSSLGEAVIQEKTGCTSFTNGAAIRYERAVLCYVINALVTTRPALMKLYIKSIEENSTTIQFNSGKDLLSYEKELSDLINGLAIRSTYGGFTYTNEYTFYS